MSNLEVQEFMPFLLVTIHNQTHTSGSGYSVSRKWCITRVSKITLSSPKEYVSQLEIQKSSIELLVDQM